MRMKENCTKFKAIQQAAALLFGEIGFFAYDRWEAFNRLFFNDDLPIIAIQWGLTPYGRSLGHYNPEHQTITLHWSLIDGGWKKNKKSPQPRPFGLNPSRQLVEDVLLHEMLHQHLHHFKLYKPKDDPHHCVAWSDELNRVASKLFHSPPYYPYYKRTKDKSGRNVWGAVVEASNINGKRIATKDEVVLFPRTSVFPS